MSKTAIVDKPEQKVKVRKAKRVQVVPADVKPVVAGTIRSPDALRPTARGTRFVVSCAQNNTRVHQGFWRSLQQFCKHNDAALMISRFSYNKSGWQKITKDHVDSEEELWYAPEIEPYVQDEQVKLASNLVFCAELDILPTAVNPLSGLDNYTGTHSAIVPHAKVHMRSMAGLYSGQPQRHLFTTGTVTKRNYIDRRAGQIASYHHVYGALYVEVDKEGQAHIRQLIAADDGSFYDLKTLYTPDGAQYIEQGEKIINLGDIHAEKLDSHNLHVVKDFLGYIKPKYVAIHDLLDFEARNHHNRKDPFFLADQHFNGMNTVEKNFEHAVAVLEELTRATRNSDVRMLLVRSNHDQAFDKWLREFDGKYDPANARFYHEHMAARYASIEANREIDSYQLALENIARKLKVDSKLWWHIKEDQSFVEYDIEFGIHGHLGPNGAKGSPRSYRQLGRKLNTGHTHSPGIIDGVWTAGVLASLNMGYNKGPSSWAIAHILTHENGKRQMVFQFKDRWRA